MDMDTSTRLNGEAGADLASCFDVVDWQDRTVNPPKILRGGHSRFEEHSGRYTWFITRLAGDITSFFILHRWCATFTSKVADGLKVLVRPLSCAVQQTVARRVSYKTARLAVHLPTQEQGLNLCRVYGRSTATVSVPQGNNSSHIDQSSCRFKSSPSIVSFLLISNLCLAAAAAAWTKRKKTPWVSTAYADHQYQRPRLRLHFYRCRATSRFDNWRWRRGNDRLHDPDCPQMRGARVICHSL